MSYSSLLASYKAATLEPCPRKRRKALLGVWSCAEQLYYEVEQQEQQLLLLSEEAWEKANNLF